MNSHNFPDTVHWTVGAPRRYTRLVNRALLLVTVWPEPESSAAGWRVLNVIDALREAGYSVAVGSPSKESRFSTRLREAGIETHCLPINDSTFDSWIAEKDFDVAILDRFVIEEQFGWRIAEHSPRTVRILDTEDLHFLRRARQEALKNGADLNSIFDDRIDLFTEDAAREIASIYRSDLSLILSDHELNLLKARFRVDPELLIPFRFCYRDLPATPAFESRSNFVSIGNFRHPPNADGVAWLKEEIWPRIRAGLPPEHASAEMHVYGSYPSKEAMTLSSSKEAFFVKGPALSAHETLEKYRVSLAPLRFGAGIKGKISDSWRAGTPVVTTPIGAEGMTLSEGVFGGEIARDADCFAREAIRLYSENAAWASARNRGHEVLSVYFDFKTNAAGLIQAISELRERIETRRQRNFVGRILSYHALRSTKYFSKWIELKEALRLHRIEE